MKIKLTYFNALPNFGDMLNEWFLKNVFKTEFEKCEDPHNEINYCLFGSVLHCTTPKTIVWGSGLISEDYGVDQSAKILCVRGPLSRRRCGRFMPIGDPALLLPTYFPKPDVTFKGITLIPHYNDYEEWKKIFADRTDVKIVNVLDDVEKVIREASNSTTIYSSSLHGLILADAYDIPSAWICSANVVGNNVKYYDYFLSVGRRTMKRHVLQNIVDGTVTPTPCKRSVIKELQTCLIDTCPFEGLIRN